MAPRLLDTQILDGKLSCGSEALLHGGYIIFGWGTKLPNLKVAKLKNMVFWPKFPNLMPAKFLPAGSKITWFPRLCVHPHLSRAQ